MAENFEEIIGAEGAEDNSDEEESGSNKDDSDSEALSTKSDDKVESGSSQPTPSQSQEKEMKDLRLGFDSEPLELENLVTSTGRLSLFKEDHDDEEIQSVSGFSCLSRTTAATIAPEVIKDRIRKTYSKNDKLQAKKRIRAKGEANATTRSRRENNSNIRQSTGIWGWE